MVIILVISGIYNIITTVTSSNCGDTGTADNEEQFCTEGFIGSFTIANKSNNIGSLTAQLALNLCTVVAVTLFFHILRFQFRKMVIDVDNETITPSDFTLILKGVPPLINDDEIIKWMESLATEKNSVEVKKINRSYDIKNYIHYTEKKMSLVKKRDWQVYKNDTLQIRLLEEKIEEVEKNLEELRKSKFVHTEIAFVTFKTALRIFITHIVY